MIMKSKQYQQDVEMTAQLPLDWGKLRRTSILLTGACGLIGSFLIDVLMCRNRLALSLIHISEPTRH